MSDRTTEITVRQTLDVPMQSIDEVQDHADALQKLVEWTDVGVLFDDQPEAVLVLQLNGSKVVGVCRFCLSPEESAKALNAYGVQDIGVDLRCCEGHTLERDEINCLDALTEIWGKIAIVASDASADRRFFSAG